MKHLGDITKINGAEVEPVWAIIGGSPCQDLSVAGKRAGLAGARSGLFMEQIRVIKEMRQHERDIGRANDMVRPRYMVWENVPGAFSSNKGEDFRAVLEETARIADGNAVVPQPPNGKWSNAGAIMGNGWSIAWRVHDAQFWGVPQRRRRISLVADFGGHSAPEILFERKGVPGDTAESGTAGEGITADVERDADTTECITPWDCQSKRIFNTEGKCPTLQGGAGGGVNNPAIFPAIARSLTARNDGRPCIDRGPEIVCAAFKGGQGSTAGGIGYAEEISPTIAATPSGSNQVPVVLAQPIPINDKATRYKGGGASRSGDGSGNGLGVGKPGDPSPTLTSGDRHAVFDARGNGGGAITTYSFQRTDELKESHIASTQSARQYKSPTDLVAAVDCRNGTKNPDINGTLQAKEQGQNLNSNNVVRSNMTVRRLTPLECERLQGYPDGWTDISGASDSARYKATGNSIALPFWRWMLNRMSTYLPPDATLGSLFDGIGGFPLIWEEIHGKGSARWASEIEPFPIRVTEYHFGRADDE